MRITRLAETAFPLEVNSLHIGPDGSLTRIDPREHTFGFRFECLGLGFAASTKVRKGKVWLQIVGTFGPVPYTAESADARRDAMAIVRASEALPHGRIVVSPDRQIQLSGELPLTEPLTPVHVVSAAAELVIEMKPLVALLSDFLPKAKAKLARVG